jgi:hypothetical protein
VYCSMCYFFGVSTFETSDCPINVKIRQKKAVNLVADRNFSVSVGI